MAPNPNHRVPGICSNGGPGGSRADYTAEELPEPVGSRIPKEQSSLKQLRNTGCLNPAPLPYKEEWPTLGNVADSQVLSSPITITLSGGSPRGNDDGPQLIGGGGPASFGDDHNPKGEGGGRVRLTICFLPF